MVEKRLLEANIGEVIRGERRKITKSHLDSCCNALQLVQPFLLSDEGAREIGFKKRMAPGSFMFGLAFALLGERIAGLTHIGTEKLKVEAPLYVDDEVVAYAKVIKKRPISKGRGLLTWAWEVKNSENKTLIKGENT